MQTSSRGSPDDPDRPEDFGAREMRTCPVCGARFSATEENEFCPVCMLHKALAREAESTVAVSEDTVRPTPEHAASRFEHYEIVLNEDGKPLELGRGAMGVTYKALDVDLRCPVTLKVISEKYLGDEAARVRFLREARAAASVRHPNVASVFHLGRRGQDYFYAMEFVEGETLDSLIKRSRRLDVNLALEITKQVAAGLTAVHKQKLVHRDIKPSNIMVSFEEEGAVRARIIDLGLAKAVDETGAQTTISASGAFAGTPEFASPEQTLGGEVDIRSDLYSLGVSLWQMLTGHVPFRGTAAGVMSQHQHAALPLEKLQGLPQPVVSLIELLLDKDPAGRFQTPAELLKTLAPAIGALEEGRTIAYQGSGKMRDKELSSIARKSQALGPEKISVARLPVTGSDLFGREEDIAFLNDAWANPNVNLVTIVAWAGAGKSTLINHWLRTMAGEHYRSAELVFGWSFYRQGTRRGTSSANEFIDAALTWFGDADPRIGTAWEKGERLANLISHRRTLLVLDGLEPLQYPPGPQEGRLREPSLEALLKELAAFNMGLCVISTRLPIADIADCELTSAPRRDLEQLSSDAGAKLLRALGVRGDQAELRSSSDEFNGHCLALTLLGSYLTDVYDGDIRCRKEVSGHLGQDVRQGVHARKVMESYQTWFGDGPELAVLRILGLFDRPADEKAVQVLLKPPAIAGLTEFLVDLGPTEWRTILARLRRARLLAGEDLHNRGQLDAHPLVREYFGEQLRTQRTGAWKECNRRLFDHYRNLAPPLPESFREMEPLFLAVTCGCHAGMFREALHQVYIPRIQRGSVGFAANFLGAREALLSVLVHFFEQERWGSPVRFAAQGQGLTTEDQLDILIQAAAYLTATRGPANMEARLCYERAESLCHPLDHRLQLYAALLGLFRCAFVGDKLSTTKSFAERLYSVAEQQTDSSSMIAACGALGGTHYFLGNFQTARQYTTRALQIWRSGAVQFSLEEVDAQPVACLSHEALLQWHLGEIPSCDATVAEAISLARKLNDMHGLAVALAYAARLAYYELDPEKMERVATELVELSRRYGFMQWLALGKILRGWTRGVSGKTAEGLLWIEEGLAEIRSTGTVLWMSYFFSLKAEILHLGNHAPEALQALREAEAFVESTGGRYICSDLHRLRGIFLSAAGGEDIQINTSFCQAVRTAEQQKSVSLQKRAEASYAEYRRQKASGLGGRGFRLPLC
jgi:serine/threonine protein kinase